MKAKLFVYLFVACLFLAVGVSKVGAVCTGQFKCAEFNDFLGICTSIQSTTHTCQGSTENTCNEYIYACPGGCVYNDTCSWSGTTPTTAPSTAPSTGSGTCAASCNTSSDCASGYSCTNDKVCWNDAACGGTPVSKHRIKVKALNCSGQNQSGVIIKAWGQTCKTGSDGTCIIFKNTACQASSGGERLPTSVVAGKDTADSTQANYYSRVDSPSFNRGSCQTNINCNFNGSPLTSSPYREAYYISPENKSENEFGWLFCSWANADANTGFDFKQISGCPPQPTPTPTLSPPTCTKNNWPTSISATGTGTFSVTGADPDSVRGSTATRVDFQFTKQLTNYCSLGEGNAVDGQWQKLGGTHWNSWNASETLNNATLNLPAGTYMMTADLRDNDNQFSTGNSGPPEGCGWPYNGCNGTFTVLPPPSSCTATLAPNLSLSVGEEDNLSLIVTGAGSIKSAVWSKTSNAFGMSSTGTNSKTITGVSAGSGTVNVNVTMLSGATCQASAMVNVNVPPACTVTLNPATLNMAVGESRSVVVGVYNPPFGAPRLRWTMGNMNVARIASGGLTA